MTNDYAVIISARMSSERLPGKAIAEYCDEPNLAQIVGRWRSSKRDPLIIVATSDGEEDDVISDLCADLRVHCYRGERNNVVARMNGAVKAFAPQAKYIARALADNPIVDVELADGRLDTLADTGADGIWYVGDESRITYCGTTDVWSRAAWDRIAAGSSGSQLEHPGQYFWENMNKFSVIPLQMPRREYLQAVRTELDTPKDLAMFRALFELWRGVTHPRPMSTLWALEALRDHPEIAALNADVVLKTQSRATWAKGSRWLCKACQRHIGSVVAGDLEVRCAKCGKPQKFYAMKPKR